jgi:hypothetical protein
MIQRRKLFNHYPKLITLFLVIYHSCSNYKISDKMKYRLNFYTEYNQFYISDRSSMKATGSISFWTTDAYDDRLAKEDGILGIGTQSYGHIKGELDILNTVNNIIDTNRYDHIVEGGIKVTSGVLQVFNCPTSEMELEIKLKPGTYRVRVYSSGLKTTDIDENEGDDHYKIEIWPDNNMERKVLKRYVSK